MQDWQMKDQMEEKVNAVDYNCSVNALERLFSNFVQTARTAADGASSKSAMTCRGWKSVAMQ